MDNVKRQKSRDRQGEREGGDALQITFTSLFSKIIVSSIAFAPPSSVRYILLTLANGMEAADTAVYLIAFEALEGVASYIFRQFNRPVPDEDTRIVMETVKQSSEVMLQVRAGYYRRVFV